MNYALFGGRLSKAQIAAGVPRAISDCQSFWPERCVSSVMAGRPLPELQQKHAGVRRD